MNEELDPGLVAGLRGPADSAIREQIVAAANDHFRHFGYAKTTVSDLAKAIGFSKAYIYKFFDSKQAIGEAICSQCLGTISAHSRQEINGARTATEKLRRFLKAVVEGTVSLLLSDRRVFELASVATAEQWPPYRVHMDTLQEMLRTIILAGRESGEFERKTPLDETCRVILQVMQPFFNPLMLEHNVELVPDAPNEVTSLILRSLAP